MHVEIISSIRGRKNAKNTMLLTQFYKRADIKIFAVRDSFFAVKYAATCALIGASLCKTHSRTPHLNPAQHVSTEPNRSVVVHCVQLLPALHATPLRTY